MDSLKTTDWLESGLMSNQYRTLTGCFPFLGKYQPADSLGNTSVNNDGKTDLAIKWETFNAVGGRTESDMWIYTWDGKKAYRINATTGEG